MTVKFDQTSDMHARCGLCAIEQKKIANPSFACIISYKFVFFRTILFFFSDTKSMECVVMALFVPHPMTHYTKLGINWKIFFDFFFLVVPFYSDEKNGFR